MPYNHLVVALALAGSLSWCGCSGYAKPVNRERSQPPAAATSSPDAAKLLAVGAGSRARRFDGAFSVYKNPEHGLSFSYPRNYELEESALEDSASGEQQEELDTGVKLLATVLIPDDTYPNTNFAHASLQVLVNESVNEQGCRELIATGDATHAASAMLTAQRVLFWHRTGTWRSGQTETVEREYAGFFDSRCYAFHTEVELRDLTNQEGARERQADREKILAQLEKIVASVRLQAPTSSSEGGSQKNNRPRL
jgi:hypothetical protein